MAIPKRLESITEDVERQKEREKDLQARFQEVSYQMQQLQPQPY